MKRFILWFLILGTVAILILSACSEAAVSLDGTSWSLSSYLDNTGETVSVLPRSTTTALFQATEVSGISGCNNYSASYQVNRNKLSIGQPTTTRKVCNSPVGIMQQEKIFLAALNSTASYKISRNSLEMIDDRGKTLLIFRNATE